MTFQKVQRHTHRMDCGHTINTKIADLPCGTNCRCPGSEEAGDRPFLCTACLETEYLTGYFAIRARFRLEYPTSVWPIIDEIKVGAILRLCAQLEQVILHRVPGLREGVGDIGTFLAQLLTEDHLAQLLTKDQHVEEPTSGEPENERSASHEPEYERYEVWITEYLEWVEAVVEGRNIDPDLEELIIELATEVEQANSRT
ncbi:hypothetical protein BU16DRAFT_9483 [Lophium mytilinum]|uniref:Uncharacterized protein n=1 Tax=Lophium mytilinum TaxID=390894 RepID=A0A6A6RFD4_9PEZI|nr:hypothetical protein BU16DRAFT_9483 [Lophium mytilinum]